MTVLSTFSESQIKKEKNIYKRNSAFSQVAPHIFVERKKAKIIAQ